MKLKLVRKYKCPSYTIGHLYINNKYFCDTLEDKVRELNTINDKIKHKTAIPKGKYKVVVTMSPRFKRLLPLLLNVPFFEGIRIHRGNDENDTSGCIIVGENKIKGKVINSTYYEKKLVELIKNEENIEIEII